MPKFTDCLLIGLDRRMQYIITSFTCFYCSDVFTQLCLYFYRFCLIYSAIQLHGCKSDNKILCRNKTKKIPVGLYFVADSYCKFLNELCCNI